MKKFSEPEIMVVRLAENDVIATSGCPVLPTQTTPDESL